MSFQKVVAKPVSPPPAKRPRIRAAELPDSKIRCSASSAGDALKHYFGCDRVFVRHLRYARRSTFNNNIKLWGSDDTVPEVPFGIGIYYERSNQLLPLSVLKSIPTHFCLSDKVTVGDLESSNAADEMINLAEIVTWMLDYMSSFDKGSTEFSTNKIEIARAFMWQVCDKETQVFLKQIEDHYHARFKSNYKHIVNTKTLDRPVFQNNWGWVNDWIKTKARAVSARGAS